MDAVWNRRRDPGVFPRLTKSLRSFCQVTGGYERARCATSAKSEDSNQRLPKSRTRNFLRFRKAFVDTVDSTGRDAADDAFQSLLNAVRELLRNEPPTESALLDDACAKLIKLFEGNSQCEITHEQTTAIYKMFGAFMPQCAKNVCSAVLTLSTLLGNERTFRRLVHEHLPDGRSHVRQILAHERSKAQTIRQFGDKIRVELPKCEDSVDFVKLGRQTVFFEDEKALLTAYNVEDVNPASSSLLPSAGCDGAVPNDSVTFGLDALRIELSRGFANTAEIIATIMGIISSDNEELMQNDLYELLGGDLFDVITNVLANRKFLLREHLYSSAGVSSYSAGINDELRFSKKHRIPNYGQQITVQSESEAILAKQLRKEEKKFRSGALKNRPDVKADFIDVDELRQQQLEYEAACNAPLFGRELTPSLVSDARYPFVFDSYADARRTAAFIAGVKLSLPDNVKREDFKKYEQITIPPSPPAPTDIGKELVKVSELDTFAQGAFEGTKTLNRIQSVVFPSAYRTNENLLICAPTGAGKTNIAMLCILREIKQNMNANGTVNKDAFKIVYVAPMKALAAEMVSNFSKRLKHLGIVVKELTGDMQLTKNEIMQTQMLVTTPEKWDVVTRKAVGDSSLSSLVRLLIIDEIHLLHDDRGPVIETLVARTLRQAEYQQRMIRIVGLSATLPNYVDVARFLVVNLNVGLFFFDGRFRPVPLLQRFIGVKAQNSAEQMTDMDNICYDKVHDFVKDGHQVMVFVHARNATGRIATTLKDLACNKGTSALFRPDSTPQYGAATKTVEKSRNRQLKELFDAGFAIHHAGMLRSDRNLVEWLFREGHVRVLCCTSTLAWGVNLPAHAVIIRGTEVYDAKRGNFVDLSILDVQQIFGRAGRPQYDTQGHGTIITRHSKLPHYLTILTRQQPIESQLVDHLADCLNSEICLGTVSNLSEAVHWLSYTFLYIRMRLNPLVYGVSMSAVQNDPDLHSFRESLIRKAAEALDSYQMIRFLENPDGESTMSATDRGRTASHFYVKCNTIETINVELKDIMDDAEILALISKASEFNQLKVREDEFDELDTLLTSSCRLHVKGGIENSYGKVNVLLQAHISRVPLTSFSLISDSAYCVQNAQRIFRGLFEIVVRDAKALLAGRILNLCKAVELQQWPSQHVLRQFSPHLVYSDFIEKLETKKLSVDQIREMDAKEVGSMLHCNSAGPAVKAAADKLPRLSIDASIRPITRTVIRVTLQITADFEWDDKWHGKNVESFWIWIEDPLSSLMHHSEFFLMQKQQVKSKSPQSLIFTIPISEPMPTQYYIRTSADRWLGTDQMMPLSFQHLILPEHYAPHTELLDLQPLPVSALQNDRLESLYSSSFTHFNAVQTQIFFTLYHTDENVLLGAPTGSGKTIAAELALFRVFREHPSQKCVYIAPLKALVRERMNDWNDRLEKKLGKRVVELTGDVTPDARAIASADVIVTTPEKWDGISRSWQTRNYVRDVGLIVIDEIHLLGEDRGPVLEVIVSRTNYITSHTDRKIRIVGLSTALANAGDLAKWLNIGPTALYNFRPTVRPVPMEVHIQGYSGNHYCPRMATMNKPIFQCMPPFFRCNTTNSNNRLIRALLGCVLTVHSGRQTRLTAMDLISLLAAETNPKQCLHMPEHEIEEIIRSKVKDSNLRLTLHFGIGMHHSGLQQSDREVVEQLFLAQKIRVLIATATLAWGVNFPARLVIVKGTEYYDGKTKRYVDFPITDVLQMMGRAGRPQFDTDAVAVIMVHDKKKHFYKKFLFDPFPVESSLLPVLSEHLNAEIVAGTICSKEDALEYLMLTYFCHRLLQNPTYYGLEDVTSSLLNAFLSTTVNKCLGELVDSSCIEIMEDERTIRTLTLGRISSFYYLNHKTMKLFKEKLTHSCALTDLLNILSETSEHDEIPVRHNEDQINAQLAASCRWPVNECALDSSHTKANLLYQTQFSRSELPSSDYITDRKSVLDNCIRIVQAMLDVVADAGWLATSLKVIQLMQMIVQAVWFDDSSLAMLPHISPEIASKLTHRNKQISIPELFDLLNHQKSDVLSGLAWGLLNPEEISKATQVARELPQLGADVFIDGWWQNGVEMSRRTFVFDVDPSQASEIDVHADQEYWIVLNLQRLNKYNKRHAHAPYFTKAKDEGWIVILGDIYRNELLALKRIGFVGTKSCSKLLFRTPARIDRVCYRLFLMSDCYVGLDQQFDLRLNVTAASIEAQCNTELE